MPTNIFRTVKSKFSALSGGRVLYYPGCMTAGALPSILNNYKALLSDLGVDFVMINELSCCGSPLLNAGYAQDFEGVKKKNLEILQKHGITKIITNCPHCFSAFKNFYGFEVEHITQTLFSHKQKLAYNKREEVVYHDPCILSRGNSVFDEPRALLRQAGFKIIEPARAKDKTFCCGAGGELSRITPKLPIR